MYKLKISQNISITEDNKFIFPILYELITILVIIDAYKREILHLKHEKLINWRSARSSWSR